MTSLQGQFLIASPKLEESPFCKSVLLMVQHDEDGALGLILNRPTNISIHQAWREVSDLTCRCTGYLRIGGPCRGPLMSLHAEASVGEQEVLPGLFFSVDDAHVSWLISHGVEPLRCYIGYAGWAPGQLEDELDTGSWKTLPASVSQVLNANADLWHHLRHILSRQMRYPNLPSHLIPPDPSVN